MADAFRRELAPFLAELTAAELRDLLLCAAAEIERRKRERAGRAAAN